jgi:Plavaka transposase
LLLLFQTKLPQGATVSPIILASDKTNLSQFGGDKQAWPVYLTIGNLSKDIRRQPSSHGSVLIGYLPVAKLLNFPKSACSNAQYRLYHQSMRTLLEPLVKAGTDGINMTCADGFVRRVFPIHQQKIHLLLNGLNSLIFP